MPELFKTALVIINPASGKDEPILNSINDVFKEHGVKWDARITHKFGDATEFAREAAADSSIDIVIGYGGDGTQHELANGTMGTGQILGVLPGGTGNGFNRELGMSRKTVEALQQLCISKTIKHIDAAQVEDHVFIQRLYTGIEPEAQTSREQKDKYGVLAYPLSTRQLLHSMKRTKYRLVIDGKEVWEAGLRCYVVNSGRTGSGLTLSPKFDPADGLLDVIMINDGKGTIVPNMARMLNLKTHSAQLHYYRCQEVTIETEDELPVWTDGEYTGRTPVTVKINPGALPIVVP